MRLKDVYAWNAVDAMSPDGLLRRGLVVDRQDDGLLIDFITHPPTKPQLFSWENLYTACDGREGLWRTGGDVFVLLQLSADQPWTWYPATNSIAAVCCCPGREVLLDFCRAGVRIRGMFPPHRVKCMTYPHSKGQLGPSDYLKKTVRLPHAFTAHARQILYDYWKDIGHALPCALTVGNIRDARQNNLAYIYSQEMGDHLREFAGSVSELLVRIISEQNDPAALPVLAARCNAAAGLATANVDAVNSIQAAGEGSIIGLQRDPLVLAELWHCLDSLSRTRLRRVCGAWQSAIDATEYRRSVLHVDFRLLGGSCRMLTACLWHCATSRTTVLIFTGDPDPRDTRCAHAQQCGTYGPDRIVATLQHSVPGLVPLATFIFANMTLPPAFLRLGFLSSGTQQWRSYQSLCRRLVLSNVNVSALFAAGFYLGGGTTGRNLRAARLVGPHTVSMLEEDFSMLELIDDNCPAVCEKTVQRVVVGMGRLMVDVEPRALKAKAVLRILRDHQQRTEPLAYTPQAARAALRAAQLDKLDNVRKLRRTTLAILSDLMLSLFTARSLDRMAP